MPSKEGESLSGQLFDERLMRIEAIGNDDGRQLPMSATDLLYEPIAGRALTVLHGGAVVVCDLGLEPSGRGDPGSVYGCFSFRYADVHAVPSEHLL